MSALIVGDAQTALAAIPDASIQCCITSPPYWGLRDYGTATWDGGSVDGCDHKRLAYPPGRETPGGRGGSMPMSETPYRETCGKCGATRTDQQLGLEATPAEYVERMVAVFRDVRRVLRDDGTLWLNLADSYSGNNGTGEKQRNSPSYQARMQSPGFHGAFNYTKTDDEKQTSGQRKNPSGFRTKNLIGIPWRVAFALQADGWYLRSDIIWAKPNPMPESVTDRPTKAHEYLFLLSKSERYYYDAEAIAEPAQEWTGRAATFERDGPVAEHVLPGQGYAQHRSDRGAAKQDGHGRRHAGFNGRWDTAEAAGATSPTRNRRTVWTVATQPYSEAHFATMPPELVRPCILAGSRQHDRVLDPFAGAGTVWLVANRLQRDFIGVELNPAYAEMARRRVERDAPLFLPTHTPTPLPLSPPETAAST